MVMGSNSGYLLKSFLLYKKPSNYITNLPRINVQPANSPFGLALFHLFRSVLSLFDFLTRNEGLLYGSHGEQDCCWS